MNENLNKENIEDAKFTEIPKEENQENPKEEGKIKKCLNYVKANPGTVMKKIGKRTLQIGAIAAGTVLIYTLGRNDRTYIEDLGLENDDMDDDELKYLEMSSLDDDELEITDNEIEIEAEEVYEEE